MACPKVTQGSNFTGLSVAKEGCIGDLPVAPKFLVLEPNSYSGFGRTNTLSERSSINPSRQRQKGKVTDFEAKAGFNLDFMHSRQDMLWEGLLFADVREKPTTAPTNSDQIAITTVATNEYQGASGLGVFKAGLLVLAQGFSLATNNGIKTVTAATATKVTVSETLADETPSSDARLDTVGTVLAAGEASIVLNGDNVRLALKTVAPSILGVIVGEWLFLGGDSVDNRLVNNVGFARIGSIGTNYIEFDKVNWTPKAETAASKSVHIYFGNVIKNEKEPDLIKTKSFQLERTLGKDDNGTMSEYVTGAILNEASIDMPLADYVKADLTFVAKDTQYRDGTLGVKPAIRPVYQDVGIAYNTSLDMTRIKLGLVGKGAASEPLFAFGTAMNLAINNNVSTNKALGVVGSIEATAGQLEVSGSVTVYFKDLKALEAVKNNADVTIDVILADQNRATVFDLPLVALGTEGLSVNSNEAITLELEVNAAEGAAGHTFLYQSFNYVPNIAYIK